MLCEYRNTLERLANIVFKYWSEGRKIEIDILTHILNFKNHKECKAGTYSITLGPDRKFYLCPAFYFDENSLGDYSIGTLDTGINNRYEKLFNISTSKICDFCDAYQCTKCSFVSKKRTNEFCVPPEIFCLKGNIEREASRYFCKLLSDNNLSELAHNLITQPLTNLDPILRINIDD